MFAVFGQRMVDITKDNEDKAVNDVLDVIVDEVKLAKSVEDGYKRKFNLPKSVMDYDYENITIDNYRELVITYKNKEYVRILPDYVVGGFCFKQNNLPYYELAVTKFADIISVSSCFNCSYSFAICANAEKYGWCVMQDTLFPGFNETCCTGHCKCCPY